MSVPLRVLVVDDNPQDRGLVVRELRKAYPGAEIQEAIDQAQLDDRIRVGNFDVVVTDFHLQWSDGIRVLQAVKQRAPYCPVIMFTGTGSEEIAVEAMKQGLDDYIIKNVKHLVRLRGAVQAAVENAKTRAQAAQLASRLESLLSQLRVGVFTCSPEGRFLELNDAMLELLACESAADASQTTIASLLVGDGKAREFLRRVTESGAPQESEIEVATPEGTGKCYRVNARLVHTDGEHPRIDGLVEDVTRRKQSEAEARLVAVAVAQVAMLSPREKEVLDEVVAGNPNKVIARHLNISDKTVEKHRANLMKKLRVRSVPGLVRLAMLAESSAR
jgi:PAS domain S-box-containing protein